MDCYAVHIVIQAFHIVEHVAFVRYTVRCLECWSCAFLSDASLEVCIRPLLTQDPHNTPSEHKAVGRLPGCKFPSSILDCAEA